MAKSDISLEPLINRGATGVGVDKKPGFVPIDTVGVATHDTEVAVTATAEEITITAGKRSIEIYNSGTKTIWYGGVGVTYLLGIPIRPQQVKIYNNVKDSFSVYIVAQSGSNSTRRIVEYS